MKRFVPLALLTLQILSLLFAPLSARAQIVAPASATFVPDPESAAQIQAVQQGYYDYMNPAVAPTPIDPAILAAQEAAAAQKRAQNAAMIQGAAQMCTSLLGGNANAGNVSDLQDLSLAARDAEYAKLTTPEYIHDMPTARSTEIGAAAAAQFASGCNNFITKDGKLGEWGRIALMNIENEPNLMNKIPDDFARLCPGLPDGQSAADKSARAMYYVWGLAAVSSTESGCKPTAILRKKSPSNPKGAPNGDAVGLFQLWHEVCPKYTDQQLFTPARSIECAIDRLGKEMGRRDDLLTTTGKTYWGTLRTDPAAVDKGGAARTKALLSQYSLCKK